MKGRAPSRSNSPEFRQSISYIRGLCCNLVAGRSNSGDHYGPYQTRIVTSHDGYVMEELLLAFRLHKLGKSQIPK